MAPMDLTSELAKTSSLFTFGQTGVLLLWNAAKEDRSWDPVSNYQVQRMVNGGEWEDLHTTTNTDTFHTDEDLPEAGEMRAYRVRSETDDEKVSPWSNTTYFPGMHGMDTAHVMAVTPNPLMAQTVDIDEMVTVDASAGFTGDMLMYSVESSNDAVAMATVDEMSGMVTITGMSDGMATITVTATDSAMATAMQTIAVTVPSPMLMPPSNIRATQDGNMVTIMWDGGENADTFTVAMLTRKDDGSWDIPNAVYDQNVAGSPHPVNMATRPAGTYLVGVAAGTDEGEWTDWVTISLDYQPNGGPPQIGG